MKRKCKMGTCKTCGEHKEIYAYGQCSRCYQIDYRKNPKNYQKALKANREQYAKKVKAGRCTKCGRELTFGDAKTRCNYHNERNGNLKLYGAYRTTNELRLGI